MFPISSFIVRGTLASHRRFASGTRSSTDWLLEKVLVKGHPHLAKPSSWVEKKTLEDPKFQSDCQQLCDTLIAFRQKHGYGRAMAAPQIGLPYRVLALNLESCQNDYSHLPFGTSKIQGPFCLINPIITWKSKESKTLWDDCLSLPDMMVRVRRSEQIQVEWMGINDNGQEQQYIWAPEQLQFDLSELLQHEVDHLEGRLATDIVEDYEVNEENYGQGGLGHPSIVSRSEFLNHLDHYKSYVNYII